MAEMHLLVATNYGWKTHCGIPPGRDEELIPLGLFVAYKAKLCPGCQLWPQPAFLAQKQPAPQHLQPVVSKEPEKAFMARIIAEAQQAGWLVFHPFDSRRSTPGFPDLCMVRGEAVLFAELKTDTGRVTPAQQVWLDALQHVTRCAAYLWRPTDWQAILSQLHQEESV